MTHCHRIPDIESHPRLLDALGIPTAITTTRENVSRPNFLCGLPGVSTLPSTAVDP